VKIIKPINTTLVSSTVTDTSYTAWSSVTAYTAGQFVSFTNHGEYQALTNNTNKSPDINPTDWKFLGTTNRWRLFDQFLNTQTVNTTSMQYVLSAYDTQAIFIGNITNVISARIEIIDNSTSAVIEDVTLSASRESRDWYEYFFGVLSGGNYRSLLYERTTLTRDVSVRVTISGNGSVGVGTFVIGTLKDIGYMQYGLSLGSLDYSVVATDTSSGATYLSKGNSVRILSGSTFIPTSLADACYDDLIEIQGIPAVFYDGIEATRIYGFIKKFTMPIKSPVETLVEIEIQGLI
jgi:hypothetical protein